jgi:hypothetical protein
VFTEVLRPSAAREPEPETPKTPVRKRASRKTATSIVPPPAPAAVTDSKPEFPKAFVLSALEQSSDDAGWAHLSTFGSYLTKLAPDFDSRLYGYKKLSDLVKARTDLFDTEERQQAGSQQRVLYLRAHH